MKWFLLPLAVCLFAACATPPAPPSADEGARLRQLLADSDETQLRLHPLRAVIRGDRRVARFGEPLSDAHQQAARRAIDDDLVRLAELDRGRLSATDRVAYDAFRWSQASARRGLEPQMLAISLRLPLDQMNGSQVHFATLSSGSGTARYRTVADYDDGLERIDGFVAWLGAAEQRFREGIAAGIVHPRAIVERIVEQFDAMAGQRVEDSPFHGPIAKMPADIAPAERQRLTEAYARALRERIAPALARMRDFLRDEYLPRARASVGLGALPGGADYYRYLVAERTTTAMAPEEIHRLGLAEVERIAARMEAIKAEVGFAGSLREFFDHLRRSPRFRPASVQAMTDGYREIGKRVDAALPKLFSKLPRTPLEIRPTPPHAERGASGASYTPGTPDGSRPGVFHFNTFDLPSRSTMTMETLYLHEALPGHHLDGMLALENPALPPALRYRWLPAYGEGWALYAESLGPELGLFTDPYQRFGHHSYEMLRALRLVADTGIHTMGWTREQAIEYLLANAALGRTEAVNEVDRYIVWPAQALTYKVGALTIQRLRAKAENALSPRFDIRAFHDQVLGTGRLPLAVLEAKIDGWIAAGGRSARPRDKS